jgi:hypothetical protein
MEWDGRSMDCIITMIPAGGGCAPAFGFQPVLFGLFFSMSERLDSIYTSDESSGFFMIG